MRRWWELMWASPTSSPPPLASTTAPSRGSSPSATSSDREKRRRKAKLRACLKKKGVERLPSTRNPKLARTVRQEINRAVNELYREHPGCQIAFERLNVATMRFKARRMNAYLYASNLAHIPKQVAWGAAKRGVKATAVKSAYTSQECPRCHFVDQEQSPRAANVLLWGLWLADARRPQCGGQYRRATRRPRDPGHQNPAGAQGAPGCAPSALAHETGWS